MIGCMQCVAKCFERIIKYISRHAFTETVLRSIGFCNAAVKAFSVITSNVLRFGLLSGISELVMLFGTFAIAASTTIAGYFLLNAVDKYTGLVFETFAPLIVSLLKSNNLAHFLGRMGSCFALHARL